MHPALRLALVVSTVVATAGTSHADWGYGNLVNPYATQLYYDAFGHGRRGASDNESSGSEAAPEPAHRAMKATDFKRSGGRPVLDEFLASTGVEGADLEELRTALVDKIAELEAPVRKNNVAAAMGVLFETAYRAVNDIEIDDASRDRVIAFLNDALAVQRSFIKLKPRGRQDAADTALVQAALIDIAVAQEDPAVHQVGLDGARTALRYLTGSETGDVESNPPALDYGPIIP